MTKQLCWDLACDWGDQVLEGNYFLGGGGWYSVLVVWTAMSITCVWAAMNYKVVILSYRSLLAYVSAAAACRLCRDLCAVHSMTKPIIITE